MPGCCSTSRRGWWGSSPVNRSVAPGSPRLFCTDHRLPFRLPARHELAQGNAAPVGDFPDACALQVPDRGQGCAFFGCARREEIVRFLAERPLCLGLLERLGLPPALVAFTAPVVVVPGIREALLFLRMTDRAHVPGSWGCCGIASRGGFPADLIRSSAQR